jgi:hypothetical protein
MQRHGSEAGADATVMPGAYMLNVDGRSYRNGGYGGASAGPDSFGADASAMDTLSGRQTGTRGGVAIMSTRGTRVSKLDNPVWYTSADTDGAGWC